MCTCTGLRGNKGFACLRSLPLTAPSLPISHTALSNAAFLFLGVEWRLKWRGGRQQNFKGGTEIHGDKEMEIEGMDMEDRRNRDKSEDEWGWNGDGRGMEWGWNGDGRGMV